MTPLPSDYRSRLETLAAACGVSGLDHLPVVSRANAEPFAADLRAALAEIDRLSAALSEMVDIAQPVLSGEHKNLKSELDRLSAAYDAALKRLAEYAEDIHRLSSALAVAEKALREIGEAKHGVVDWQITGQRTVTCEEHAAAALATLNPTKEEAGC